MTQTCGNCHWRREKRSPGPIINQEVASVCYGGPPTPVQRMIKPGVLAVVGIYPPVGKDTQACGFWMEQYEDKAEAAKAKGN